MKTMIVSYKVVAASGKLTAQGVLEYLVAIGKIDPNVVDLDDVHITVSEEAVEVKVEE